MWAPRTPAVGNAKRCNILTVVAAVVGVLIAIGVIVAVHAGGPPRDEASYRQGFDDAKKELQTEVGPVPGGFCEDRYEVRLRAGAQNVKKDYVQGCLDAGGKD